MLKIAVIGAGTGGSALLDIFHTTMVRHLAYSKFTVKGRMIISNMGDALHGNLVNANPLT